MAGTGGKRVIIFVVLACTFLLALAVFAVYFSSFMKGDPGPDASDFTLIDLNGTNFTLSAQKGKVVLLDFMDTSSSDSSSQVPLLNEIFGKYWNSSLPSNFTMITISVNPADSSRLAGWKHDTGCGNWTFAVDSSRKVGDEYGILVVPRIVLVDRNGKLGEAFSYGVTAAQLEARLDSMV